MAEAFAFFKIRRTMGNLTFYVMEGRNFVRKKSSLTRRKVLYSPQFARTRHNAGVMGHASKIGSQLYNALPEYWRQGWMYRSFTGEAYTMLKKGKKEDEIHQLLWQRYVALVVNQQPTQEAITSLPVQPKRTYRKQDTDYWRRKTIKSKRRKAHKEKVLLNAGLMGRASKIGSKLYARLGYKCRGSYQRLTGWAMKLLKEELDEADIIAAILPLVRDQAERSQQSGPPTNTAGILVHPGGQYYFITSRYKRFVVDENKVLPDVCYSLPYTSLLANVNNAT